MKLTDTEERALDHLNKAAEALYRICFPPFDRDLGEQPWDATRAALDWNEISTKIHDLQARVMAQALTREEPTRFRRLGRRLRP